MRRVFVADTWKTNCRHPTRGGLSCVPAFAGMTALGGHDLCHLLRCKPEEILDTDNCLKLELP